VLKDFKSGQREKLGTRICHKSLTTKEERERGGFNFGTFFTADRSRKRSEGPRIETVRKKTEDMGEIVFS